MGLLDRIAGRGGGRDRGSARVLSSGAFANTDQPGIRINESIEHNELWYLNMGKRPHELELEVRFPGEDPYIVQGKYRVPAKFLPGAAMQLPTDIELPVRRTGEGREDFDIDWKEFGNRPGAKKEVKRAGARQTNDAIVDNLERTQPEMQEAARIANREVVRVWVAAVKGGSLKRKYDDLVSTWGIHPKLAELLPDADG